MHACPLGWPVGRCALAAPRKGYHGRWLCGRAYTHSQTAAAPTQVIKRAIAQAAKGEEVDFEALLREECARVSARYTATWCAFAWGPLTLNTARELTLSPRAWTPQ